MLRVEAIHTQKPMSSPEPSNLRLVEAARYALLRRLAPALRHNMAGALQPVTMMAAILERRLQALQPDLVVLGKNSDSIRSLSIDAARSCMDLMSWLAPNDDEWIAVKKGVDAAVSLVTTELSFRGFTILNKTGHVVTEVPQSLLRHVLMASLIALTDLALAPATVLLTVEVANGELLFTLVLISMDGVNTQFSLEPYRSLDWKDVQCLADAEGVNLEYDRDRVQFRYPLTVRLAT